MKKLIVLLTILSTTLVSCDYISDLFDQNKDDDSEYDYSYLDLEDYPEWDTGVITEDNTYLLIKEDTLNNGYIGYLNNSDLKDSGLALYFDKDINLTSFSTERGSCSIYWKSTDKSDFHIITESSDEFYEDIYIDPSQFVKTRVAWVPIIMAVARGANIAMTIQTSVQGVQALLNGDLETAGKSALELICGGVGGNLYKHALDDVAIDAAFAGFEKLKNKLQQTGQTKFLGNCQISMSAKKIGSKNFRLELTVSGYETVPMINSDTGVKYGVSCGIAVRKWPHVTYTKNELIIKEFAVDGNGTKSIDFELPEATGYYAVPYLIPTQYVYFPEHYVRHGNTVHLKFFDGYIDEFKQLSYTESDNTYTFKCYAHAICNTGEDEYWKLYYENDNEWKEFYSAKTYDEPSITASNTGEFEFEIKIHSDHFKNGGRKDIKLGIAKFDKSHYMINASEPQIFWLSTEDDLWVDLGLSVLWARYNVGASSPEEYGGYYAWGETEEKSSYTWENYKYYNSATDSFTHIGDDISGTQYDVATVKWGNGARMPTIDEAIELLEKCQWVYQTINGNTGEKVIGPNGNSFFIPYSMGKGYWAFEEVNRGYYWTGSADVEFKDGFYDIHGYIFYTHLENYIYDWYYGEDCSIERTPYGFSVRPVKDK